LQAPTLDSPSNSHIPPPSSSSSIKFDPRGLPRNFSNKQVTRPLNMMNIPSKKFKKKKKNLHWLNEGQQVVLDDDAKFYPFCEGFHLVVATT
jgi:hypothetical protein